MKNIAIISMAVGLVLFICQTTADTSNNDVTIKSLLDKIDSTPVTSVEAKIAFRKVVETICRVNGVDPSNGFGTTEECLNQLNNHADEVCLKQVLGSTNKEYRSRDELRSDLGEYMKCADGYLPKPSYKAPNKWLKVATQIAHACACSCQLVSGEALRFSRPEQCLSWSTNVS